MVGAQGEFPGITGGPDKGYIAIAPRDTTGAGAEASLSIGPVTEHFSNQARNSNASLVYGLAPTFAFAPAGYELETVLVASTAGPQKAGLAEAAPADPARASIPSGGVNAALMEFGDFLLKRHGKTRAAGDIRPETTYIGYSTTAYYFYNLCDCLDEPPATAKSAGQPDVHNRQSCANSPIPSHFLKDAATPGVCASYADTLIAVNAALEEQGIPIKHFLLDSWWYGEGWNGGTALWEDVPECTGNSTALAKNCTDPAVPDCAWPADSFPAGLKAFRKTVGEDKTIWVHAGLWTSSSPYRTKYEFASGARGEETPPQGEPSRYR